MRGSPTGITSTRTGWAQIRATLARDLGEARERIARRCKISQPPSTLLRGPCRHRPDDSLDIGVRSRIAMDRHMRRHIQLHPLDVAEQRHRVGTDSHSPACLQRAEGRKGAITDRVLIRERLRLQVWLAPFGYVLPRAFRPAAPAGPGRN
jgi:hypothetical protein